MDPHLCYIVTFNSFYFIHINGSGLIFQGTEASCATQFESVKVNSSLSFIVLGIPTFPCNLSSPCLNHMPYDIVDLRYHKTYSTEFRCPVDGSQFNCPNSFVATLISGRVLIVSQLNPPNIN